MIAEVVGQVQAIAQVYGLQVGSGGPLQLDERGRGDHRRRCSAPSAARSALRRTAPRRSEWTLPEAESIPIALTLNELLTNAVKHSAGTPDDEVLCTLDGGEMGVRIEISNRAALRRRLQPGAHSRRRVGPRPGARAAAAAQRAAHARAARRPRGRRQWCCSRRSSRAGDIGATRACVPARGALSFRLPHGAINPQSRGAAFTDNRRSSQWSPAGREAPGIKTMTSHPQGTILVVDDDRLVLATLAHGLTQAGYDVIDADNGDDAILLAREHRPDLALLDIRMEGMSGFDVAAYLREYCQMPFMFLSAFTDDATVRAGEGARRGRLPGQAARHRADRAERGHAPWPTCTRSAARPAAAGSGEGHSPRTAAVDGGRRC